MALIIKSNIKKVVKELDRENAVSSVAEEVGLELERKVEEILEKGIKRARANGRRTLQARDLQTSNQFYFQPIFELRITLGL